MGPDVDQLRRTLGGVLVHPNVSAAIILGLGCEVNQIDHYLGPERAEKRSLGGLDAANQRWNPRHGGGGAPKQIARFIEQAAAERRTEVPASKIVLGLNCGGSDSFSGITANPALGYCSDLLAAIGGTAVLAETTEIFGAEHLLVKRARNRQVAEKLLGLHPKLQAIPESIRRQQLRRQSQPRQQGRRTHQHPRKVAGSGRERRHISADGSLRLCRARHRAGLHVHEHSGVRSGIAHRPGRRRVQPDCFHHGAGERHRLPDHPGDQDRDQQRHVSRA